MMLIIWRSQTQEKFKVGADVLKTAQAYQDVSELLLKLGIVSCHVNSFLFHADHTHFLNASALRNKVINTMASQRALAAIDPLIYEGREVLFNRVSPLHTDRQDPEYSWAVLCAFGNNDPVQFSLPQLNLRLSFKPGDMIAIRGRGLKHQTSRWEKGQRIVLPHFTHSKVWRSWGDESALSRCDTS